MEYLTYLNIMREIQKNIIEFINADGNTDENFQKIISDQRIIEDPHIFKEIITLILCISNNHYRTASFFDKIFRIIQFFRDKITNNFSNFEIFTIFRKNYRILLFMIEEEILKPDVSIFSTLTYKKYKTTYYPHYFSPEFKSFFQNKQIVRQEMSKKRGNLPPINPSNNNENSEKFERKRKVAENDEHICEIIRNDDIDKFVNYITKYNYSLTSKVDSSIFETNTFLIDQNPTIIEYTAFFGSLKIFNYLIEKKIELTPSLWLYSIHGKNIELIHILENNKILPEDDSYQSCLLESIKCHHNEMTRYIQNKIMNNQTIDLKAVISQSVRYNNYVFFPDKIETNFDMFFDFCKYDYISIVEFLLKENLDLNQTKISIQFFLNKIYIYFLNCVPCQ